MKLTIEELKALPIGEWVWVVSKSLYRNGMYCTIDFRDDDESACILSSRINSQIYEFVDYDKTWTAYRNKEQAEAKRGVFEAPCKIGDTIYAIPSDAVYGLNMLHHNDNNKVYEQIIDEVRFTRRGWYVMTCDLRDCQSDSSLGETWFFTKEEAEEKLQERYNKWTKVYQHK